MKKLISLFVFMSLVAVNVFGADLYSNLTMRQEQVKAPKMDLHKAVIMNKIDLVKKHILAGTDLNAKEPQGGSTALITAAAFGNTEAAKLLIEAGAGLDYQNNDGSTALHTSSFLCREEIVEMLLAHGADRNIKNNYGNTALESMQAPFDKVKPVYDAVGAALKPIGVILDYEYIKKTRPIIAEMFQQTEDTLEK